MEASALTRASRGGLLARRSPLLRFEPDDRLVKLIRAGHDGAFEALFNRYHSRLLAFCTSMLKSRQDAEDVLQEVFANAHAAMLNDDRPINVRPWLYRIARNRCLNHLRKPVPEGQDSMDIHPHQGGTTTAEEVQNREDLREVLADVRTLPETQRTALLLREIDQLSYEEIAVAMDTTVPSIKSLLVRARIGLAESSKARMLTCGEVQVELAEAAEGVAKASGPARKHVRTCDDCREFRNQLRADRKALAALFPFGPIALIKGGFLAKLFGGGSAAGTSGAAASGGAAATGAAATGGAGA
ncbi:MAG: RNA polymerase sigma factor, partial [Solirubrobacterales bacterium]|nr:RNA polymerase sigma factor [Solirubrobacterales bacterium]